MKNQPTKKKTTSRRATSAPAKNVTKTSCCSTRHKVWGVIALVGLFTCGLMVGLSFRPNCRMAARVVPAQVIDVADTTAGVTVPTAPVPSHPAQTAPVAPVADKPACQVVEDILTQKLYPEYATAAAAHFENADIYVTLVERGCPENSEQFKNLALREVEIATALTPAENITEYETEIVIDTYKKMDMQAQAQQFLDKMQQLTDPAIEFILKMEKIINE